MAESKMKTSTKVVNRNYNKGASGAIYGFGLLGALVYFLQHSHSFLDVLLAILKSVAWPAVVVYKALALLGL